MLSIECLGKVVKHYNEYVFVAIITRTETKGVMSNWINSSKVHNIPMIENIEKDNASWTNNIYCMTITFGS